MIDAVDVAGDLSPVGGRLPVADLPLHRLPCSLQRQIVVAHLGRDVKARQLLQRGRLQRLPILLQVQLQLRALPLEIEGQTVALHAQRTGNVDRLGIALAAGDGRQRQPGGEHRQYHDAEQRSGQAAGHGTFNKQSRNPFLSGEALRQFHSKAKL